MGVLQETLAERILREHKMIMEERLLFEPVWQEISELEFPRRGDITVSHTPGRQRMRRLYDSTALVAAERLAAAMAGVVTPATLQWFAPEIPQTNLRIPKVVEDFVQMTGKVMFQLGLQRTEFDTEIQELYHDLVTFCTAALFIDEEDGLPTFRALHPSEYAIWTDSRGRVVKLVRDITMTIREAIKTFGLENLSEDMQRLVQQNEDVDQKFTFVQWIANRKDEQLGFPVDNFPVASIYVDVKAKHVVRKSGFDEWPCPVARWATTSGEMYGRGPGWTALPDVASLNKAEEFGLRAWAMSVMPPLLARHDGILGKPDLRPARMTFVNDEGSLQWFPPGTNLEIETVKREDKRRSIWNIFFMDQIQFVPERGKTPPSAEEVRARLNIMLQILGPTLSRVEHDLLLPTLNRVFGILKRNGKLPTAPPSVGQFAERAGRELNIEFIGPIARAKRQAESQKLDLALSSLGVGAQIDPELPDVVDLEEWLREKYRIEMVPRNIIRSREEVRQRRAERQRQMQEEAQLQQAEQASQIAKNVTPAVQATADGTR